MSARSWRANISLNIGVVSTIVKVKSAIEAEESFKTVCVGDDLEIDDDPLQIHGPHAPTPIRQTQACPTCRNSDKGSFRQARVSGDQFIVIDAGEKADAMAGVDKEVLEKQIHLSVHDALDVSLQTMPAPKGGVYYLTPQIETEKGRESYALFVETLREHPELALLGLWMPDSRINLYQVRLFGDTLVLEQRARTEHIKVEQQPVTAPNAAYFAQMKMLLPMMQSAYDPAEYRDTFRERLEQIIATKDAVTGVVAAKGDDTAKAVGATVTDLGDMIARQMAAVEAAKKPAPKKRAERKSA